jgi:IS5 family transposase
VDVASGLVHTVTGTSANVADIAQTHALLHGQENKSLLTPVIKESKNDLKSPLAFGGVRFEVAAKRGRIKAMAAGRRKELVVGIERCKAQLRASVEHPFHIIKNLFHHRKVRYRGLAKNTAQLSSLFALANLLIAKRVLLAQS